jgi:C-terminal processing protease CtpA/Prc
MNATTPHCFSTLKFLFTVALCLSMHICHSQSLMAKDNKMDFDFFWATINDEYCYFNKKQISWQKVREIYTPLFEKISTRNQLVSLLEKALYEIYDHHAILNTNTDSSRRLVPSGTDVWAEYVNGKPLITEVRKGFGAETSGIIAGMEIVSINDIPVNVAVRTFLPRSLQKDDIEARNFALRILLAGNRIQPRKFSLKYKGITRDYFPDKSGSAVDKWKYGSMVETRKIGTVGYVRINDCLYDNALIPVFDSIMAGMSKTTALILDLRETPGGGNTTVARAILGWFTDKQRFFQEHEYYSEEKNMGVKRSWKEIVSPRKNKYYNKPLVILCNHWTGSVGEGIVIGFDAMQRSKTKIVGTAMARLNGAVYSFQLPNSKIGFTFPAERLYHVNGLPREKYMPSILIHPANVPSSQATDVFIEKALNYFRGLR